MAAAKTVVQSGDPSAIEKLLVGRKLWVVVTDPEGKFPAFSYDVRVLSFKSFLPAEPPGPGQKRKKHLVQLWTDPGGKRTLSVGSLRLKDPGKTGEIIKVARKVSDEADLYDV